VERATDKEPGSRYQEASEMARDLRSHSISATGGAAGTSPVTPAPPAGPAPGQARVKPQRGFCTGCGKALRDGLSFCTSCGKPVKSAREEKPAVAGGAGKPPKAFCTGCGKPLKKDGEFCTACGRKA
jgi:predicted amidophosphoribosyltransferase